MESLELRELSTDAEFREAFVVLQELRPHLDEPRYVELLGAMRQDGYRLFGGRQNGRFVVVAGAAVRTSFPDGRHLWVYDLVTTASERSKGHGAAMLRFLDAFARSHDCASLGLSSALYREATHRFYEAHQGFQRFGYVFKKKLDKESP